MEIILESVNQSYIRNNQIGDWRYEGAKFKVGASSTLPYKSQLLVAIHEMVEAILCKEAEVSDQQVTDFDLQFELERAAGKHSATAENGDDPRAPYQQQHISATAVEMMMCCLLGMSWAEHTRNVDSCL